MRMVISGIIGVYHDDLNVQAIVLKVQHCHIWGLNWMWVENASGPVQRCTKTCIMVCGNGE